MKVVNKTKAVVYIGDKIIKPGEVEELSKEEMKMSGVKAMLDSGELEIVKEKRKKE